MNARMRVVPLPRDEYGIVFDRVRDSSALPPRTPTLDEGGAVIGEELRDFKPLLGARFVVYFDEEIDLDGDHA